MEGRIRILVAMDREAQALGIPCEVIGIGAGDIPDIAPDDTIVNVGYCGGYKLKPGAVIEPSRSISLETRETKTMHRYFKGECESFPCFTSGEFVTAPAYPWPAVYDMELAKLASVRCKGLVCLKIVSDSLDEGECEVFDDPAAWERVRELLKGAGLI